MVSPFGFWPRLCVTCLSSWQYCRCVRSGLPLDRMDTPLKDDPAARYDRGGISCKDYIVAKGMDFLEGNIVKYITRWRWKNGIKDLYKARDYIKFLIEREEGK